MIDYRYGLVRVRKDFTIQISMQLSSRRRFRVHFLAGCFARHRSRLIAGNGFGFPKYYQGVGQIITPTIKDPETGDDLVLESTSALGTSERTSPLSKQLESSKEYPSGNRNLTCP